MDQQHKAPSPAPGGERSTPARVRGEGAGWGNQDQLQAIEQLKADPLALQARMESVMGLSLPQAHLEPGTMHDDTHAYAGGGSIFLNPSIFALSGGEQEDVLLHELSHLAQAMMPASIEGAADPEADAQRLTRDVKRGRETAPGTAVSGASIHRFTDAGEAGLGAFSAYVATSGWLEEGCPNYDVVVDLQTFLAGTGDYRFRIDGSFGPRTREAVAAYQGKNSLTPDGKVGPLTAAVIDASGTVVTTPGTEEEVEEAPEAPATEAPAVEAPATDAPTSVSTFVAWVNEHGWLKLYCDDEVGVTALQTFLFHRGLYPERWIDGGFGAQTQASVQAFQRSVGLGADGEVGPLTAAAIDARNTGVTTAPATETSTETTTETTTTESHGPGHLSEKAQSTRTLILEVLAMANDRSRYSDIYENNGAQGTFLRDYMATHGRTSDRNYFRPDGSATSAPTQAPDSETIIDNPAQISAFPDVDLTSGSESGLGVQHLIDFIDNGSFDALTAGEQDAFTRAVSQLGSFYGGVSWQGGIYNRYTWTAAGYEDADQYSGWTIQDEDHVGKWDCSAFASYVQGDGYADTGGMMRDSSLTSPIWANYAHDAEGLKAVAPVGSILVKSGHCKVVIGHSGTSLLVMESEGSGHFVHAELMSATKLADTTYELLPPG